MDVAIVGIGIHPFGRTPARSGLQQGAYAARLALQDAGIEWRDIQFAFGGSASAGSADALYSVVSLKDRGGGAAGVAKDVCGPDGTVTGASPGR